MKDLRTDDPIDNCWEEMINTAIRDKGEHLRAIVNGHNIHLTGEVAGPEIKKDIAALVRKFPGVQLVINHIRIRLQAQKTPIEHF